MSNKQSGGAWWTAADKAEPDQEAYNDLAQWCEKLDPSEQRAGFDRVLQEITDFGTSPQGSRKQIAGQWIAMLVDSGAFESAAIALMPRTSTFNGGRLQNGTFVAQVILEGSAGAHSRQAQSLAMAWLAALLRAFARQAAEAKGALTH